MKDFATRTPATKVTTSEPGKGPALLDNRATAVAQRKMQETIANSPRQAAPRQQAPVQPASPRPNRTGLPEKLKAGVESLSGYSLDDVKVHYNSAKPAELQAHAYAQGTDIHLAPGQEQHLPHEVWHVVQQKQGRVKPTSFNRGVGVNDQPILEHEADVMGQKAPTYQLQAAAAPFLISVTPPASPLQLIVVGDDDIGKTYEIRPANGAVTTQGVLKTISRGGWYSFDVGGTEMNVRGQDNIIREIVASSTTGTASSGPLTSTVGAASSGLSSSTVGTASSGPLASILSSYNVTALSSSVSEFAVNEVADKYGITTQQALQMIANSFGRNPRTIRLHYPFGSKTLAKGNEAYTTPSETDKLSQAMVSHKQGDYPSSKKTGKGKKAKREGKVGKDYDDWADELSDSGEPEPKRRMMAHRLHQYLTQPSPKDKFEDLSARERAALGGILTATQVTDRLRTDINSDVTPMDFSDRMKERSEGKGTLHSIFGDKKSSTFLPARTGGSGRQRAQLSTYQQEVLAAAALWQNNCLINAIAQAVRGSNATMEELVTIRSRLGNVGRMMAATQANIDIIRQCLHIRNSIIVRYVLGSGGMNETLAGDAPFLTIYHTGGAHFQHTPQLGVHYDMS